MWVKVELAYEVDVDRNAMDDGILRDEFLDDEANDLIYILNRYFSERKIDLEDIYFVGDVEY